MKEELKYLVIDTSLENITSLNLFIGNKSTDIIYDESEIIKILDLDKICSNDLIVLAISLHIV